MEHNVEFVEYTGQHLKADDIRKFYMTMSQTELTLRVKRLTCTYMSCINNKGLD